VYRSLGVDGQTYQVISTMMDYLESQRIPMVDFAVGLPLDDPGDHLVLAKQMFSKMKPGLTHFVIHPSVDTPELRAITPDWKCRVENYRVFLSDDFRKHLEAEDIRLIGYRQIRDAMRS
jgi:hypothetical protein